MKTQRPQPSNRSLRMALAVALAWLVGAVFPTEARAQMGSDSKVSVKAVPARTVARPGDRFPIAVVLEIAPEWHVWTSESQAKALPAAISLAMAPPCTG